MAVQCAFPSCELAGFCSCLPGFSRIYSFFNYQPGNTWILFQKIAQVLVYYAFDNALYLGIAKLCFCLAFKLRLLQFNRNDCCKALSYIITGKFCVIIP